MGAWTVVGFWEENNPVPVGVIAGAHQVQGLCEYVVVEYQGSWATSVDAVDADQAEALAVAEMLDSLNQAEEG